MQIRRTFGEEGRKRSPFPSLTQPDSTLLASGRTGEGHSLTCEENDRLRRKKLLKTGRRDDEELMSTEGRV
ncbi:unnamed protein product [Calypogeia fissa]